MHLELNQENKKHGFRSQHGKISINKIFSLYYDEEYLSCIFVRSHKLLGHFVKREQILSSIEAIFNAQIENMQM